MKRIGIIGFAGGKNRLSKEIHSKLSEKLFHVMKQLVYTKLEDHSFLESKVCLVSGGAAWSDHLAVELFNDYPSEFELDCSI